MSCAKYACSSPRARLIVWPGVSPGRRYSGSSLPITSLVQRNSSSQSARGTPRIHAITASGNGAAICSTKSHSPTSAAGHRAVEDLDARCARRRPAARAPPSGVKRPLTTRRIGPCRGGSSITTISGVGITGASARASVMPVRAREPQRLATTISMMSACFVIAQNGLNPGASIRATGASARSRVHTVVRVPAARVALRDRRGRADRRSRAGRMIGHRRLPW